MQFKKITEHIYEFPIDIYHRKLWIGIGATGKECNKLFPEGDTAGDPFEDINLDSYAAVTDRVRRMKPVKAGGVLIRLPNEESINHENVTHECIHAALFIFTFIGEQVDGGHQEAFAYLAGYIARAFDTVKQTLQL